MTFASTLSSTDMFLLEIALEDMPELFRTIEGGEAKAFEAVFGTSDMGKLLEIERDPAAYWDEREQALKDEAIPHLEFCKTYTQEAQTFIQNKAAKSTYHPWFCQDPNAIANTIQTILPEDRPAYPTILALYTALACDHLEDPKGKMSECMQNEQEFLKDLRKILFEAEGFSRELNESQRWVIRDGSTFSIFDSLVALSNNEYLCGATPPDQRMSFKAHDLGYGPRFFGYSGPISHDSCTHARLQYLLKRSLRRFNIPFKDFFSLCWSKERLIKNNLLLLAEQSLGCFYNFHELPSVVDSWYPDRLSDLLHPTSDGLTDAGLLDIAPYFINNPEDVNWHTQPLCQKYMGNSELHKSLLLLRGSYCAHACRAMYRRATTRY